MLKKITILVFILSSITVKAQFTIDDDTLYAYGFAGNSPSSFVDIYGHTVIRSQSGLNETINWNRIVNAMPDTNWHSAVCDIISCRDTGVSIDSFFFFAGDTGILSFHFYVKNINSSGKMIVRFSRANNPLEYKDVVILATSWKPVGIQDISKSVSHVYPNPAGESIRIINPDILNGKIQIINTLGKVVIELPYLSGDLISISNLNTGVYTIKYSGKNTESFVKFIKE